APGERQGTPVLLRACATFFNSSCQRLRVPKSVAGTGMRLGRSDAVGRAARRRAFLGISPSPATANRRSRARIPRAPCCFAGGSKYFRRANGRGCTLGQAELPGAG